MKVVFLLLLMLPVVFTAPFLLFRPTQPQTGLVKMEMHSPPGLGRMSPIWVRNQSSGALLIWEPCRVERQETGRIVVGGSRARTFWLPGTNSTQAARFQVMMVELTGTNHGPWRILLPVARYEAVARLERWLGQPMGSLAKSSRIVESVLRHSRIWAASEWFEEPVPPGSPGFTAYWMRLRGLTNYPPLVERYGPFAGSAGTNVSRRWLVPPAPQPPSATPLQLRPFEMPQSYSPRFPVFQSQQEEHRTFMFIARNFNARYHRWPTNYAEVRLFAANKENLQPELPSSLDSSEFTNAVFTTDAAGGVKITYRSRSGGGSMSIGGSPTK